MKEIISERSFKLTIVLTFLYLSLGFLFLEFDLADYGWIIFIFIPLSLGIALGAMSIRKWAYGAMFFTVIAFLLLLYFSALEGIICIVMSLPIIVTLIFIGIWINKLLIKKGIFTSTNNLAVLSLPLLSVLFIGAPLEKLIKTDKADITAVTTSRIYPFNNKQVYDAIKSVDTLVGEKPFLMKLDLPVPNKCILEKEEVGGIRTCYFTGGTITEKITELERGKILKMDVIDYKLTGRKWLGFKEAIYLFEPVGKDSCKLIRTTTYTSVLKPRFYWEPLEKLGISQEHEYVLNNLDNDLKKRF